MFYFHTSNKIKVHQLPPEKLKQREVVHIDIANDPVTPADFKPDEDPTKYVKLKYYSFVFKCIEYNSFFVCISDSNRKRPDVVLWSVPNGRKKWIQ